LFASVVVVERRRATQRGARATTTRSDDRSSSKRRRGRVRAKRGRVGRVSRKRSNDRDARGPGSTRLRVALVSCGRAWVCSVYVVVRVVCVSRERGEEEVVVVVGERDTGERESPSFLPAPRAPPHPTHTSICPLPPLTLGSASFSTSQSVERTRATTLSARLAHQTRRNPSPGRARETTARKTRHISTQARPRTMPPGARRRRVGAAALKG
jgi:hypothetical protein